MVLGGRKLKNLKLLYLDSNHFHSTPANAKALSVLFDGGHPRQRELSLKGCGIDSELIEKSAPALSSNRKMKCLRLFENPLGDRGTAALIAAICDSTSFEKMLASNHTIAKVMVDHDQVHGLSVLEKMLRLLLWINLTNQFRSTLRGRSEIACRKLFTIVAYDVNIDPSMFLHFDIGLAPQIFFKIQDVSHPQEEKENLTAIYKILKCKEFHARLKLSSQTSRLQIDHDVLRKKEEETRMKNEQLEADNAALSEENRILKEQIASLMAQNGVGACTMANSVGSIAERVKTRAKRRKLGRIVTLPLAAYEAEVCHCIASLSTDGEIGFEQGYALAPIPFPWHPVPSKRLTVEQAATLRFFLAGVLSGQSQPAHSVQPRPRP
eukprot:scaffold17022_cov171-Skeletonema_menzelii.AAC.2